MVRKTRRGRLLLAAGISTALLTTACAGAGGGGGSTGGTGGATSINVLMVGNPQMEDIQKLTADSFTKDTGITVNYTVLPENELRDKVTQDVATQAGQYDHRRLRGRYLGQERLAPRARQLRRQGHGVRPGRPAQADRRVAVAGRQAVRRAVLWRVVVPDVPQGHHGEEGHHDP